MQSQNDDYSRYRGKCKAMSEALVELNPGYRLARGWYDCPQWGRQQHWWTVRPDGTIDDPTVLQFPAPRTGEYIEFDGWLDCEQCGKSVHEQDPNAHTVDNGMIFCSGTCYARCVGL